MSNFLNKLLFQSFQRVADCLKPIINWQINAAQSANRDNADNAVNEIQSTQPG
ncbi:hypothetical protein AU15_10455 [Marinobacter salarius]|uniref:Uncharacterized protein n=1 Tax=Marinobacter salarius TaxID=1420917 RepID=W5YVR4_9GAMM|nr:hypothetical protein AU15_10455 [Marinobacter salarius]